MYPFNTITECEYGDEQFGVLQREDPFRAQHCVLGKEQLAEESRASYDHELLLQRGDQLVVRSVYGVLVGDGEQELQRYDPEHNDQQGIDENVGSDRFQPAK